MLHCQATWFLVQCPSKTVLSLDRFKIFQPSRVRRSPPSPSWRPFQLSLPSARLSALPAGSPHGTGTELGPRPKIETGPKIYKCSFTSTAKRKTNLSQLQKQNTNRIRFTLQKHGELHNAEYGTLMRPKCNDMRPGYDDISLTTFLM